MFVERNPAILFDEILQFRHADGTASIRSSKPMARPIFISKPFSSHESTVNRALQKTMLVVQQAEC